MRLLVDEDTSPAAAEELSSLGIEATHVTDLNLLGSSDVQLFEFALANRYDGIVTHDRYTGSEVEPHALRAMINGLRIIKLGRPRREPRGPQAERERLRSHIEIIREALRPTSQIRRVTIRRAADQPELESLGDVRRRLDDIERGRL